MTDPNASPPRRLPQPDGNTIAYHVGAGKSPGVMFIGGFMSDMSGTKAMALDAMCRADGRAYVRFDYLGHGRSSGAFIDGTIGRWTADAVAVLDQVAEGPQVLVGSSMGGWIMLLTALARPARVAAMVGIAAAPDFTEDLIMARYPPEALATLARDGVYYEPSEYGDEPYAITRRLIDDGRDHLVLRRPIALTCPVRLIHGMRDPDVPWRLSLRLAEALQGGDVEVTLVKQGDHRLSEPADIARLEAAVRALCAKAEAGNA